MLRITIVLALFLLFVQSASAQTPQFQAPPGYTTQVQDVHKTFNFYKLTRNVILPWDNLLLPASKVPAGNTIISSLRCPSKTAAAFYDNPAKYIKSVGKPKRRMYQSFEGKDGKGAVLYLEFSHTLPMSVKGELSKLFFKTSNPPDPNTSTKTEQFLMNDHQIIIWCFQNHKSKVKEAHQEYIFGVVGTAAENLNSKK